MKLGFIISRATAKSPGQASMGVVQRLRSTAELGNHSLPRLRERVDLGFAWHALRADDVMGQQLATTDQEIGLAHASAFLRCAVFRAADVSLVYFRIVSRLTR
jgi:hypothetical protein